MVQKKVIEKWLRQQILVGDPDGKVTKFELVHVGLTKKASVGQYPITPESDYEDIAIEIFSAAENDVEGLGGSQRYAILAFRGAHTRPSARKTFRMFFESDDETLGDTEEATPKGLMSQQMRHNEAIMRIGFTSQETIIRHYQRMLESTGDRLAKLEERSIEQIGMMERMLSEEKMRELEERKQTSDDEFKAKMFGKLDVLLPVIANKISGKKLLPEVGESGVIKGLVDSITPAQLERLAGVLEPEQLIAFLEVWKAHSPPKEERG